MVDMDTEMLVLFLCLGFLSGSSAVESTQLATTQMPQAASEENTGVLDDQSNSQGLSQTTESQAQAKTTASSSTHTTLKLTTERPNLTTAASVLPDSTMLPSNESSKTAEKTDSPTFQQTTKLVPTSTKVTTNTVAPDKNISQTVTVGAKMYVTESIIVSTEKISNKSEDVTTESSTEINATNANDVTETTLSPGMNPDDWLHVFLRVHHFEGQYIYAGGAYLFDFVARNVHPLSTRTLVALFYDEEGAILEMNGTSADGHHITFVLNKVYTAGYRFPAGIQLELTGTLSDSGQGTLYDGNITKPVNSSFQTFHMNRGLGEVETGDAAGTRTAIIVVVPVSIAFLGIVATVTVLCWASKKGMLKSRHRSYQLFQDTPVVFESEAETIHI